MANFNNIQVGEEVYISRLRSPGEIKKVTRLTKSQFMVEYPKAVDDGFYETAFWKKNGYKVGGNSWMSTVARRVTEEVKELIVISKLKKRAAELRDELMIPLKKEDLINFCEVLENLKGKGESNG